MTRQTKTVNGISTKFNPEFTDSTRARFLAASLPRGGFDSLEWIDITAGVAVTLWFSPDRDGYVPLWEKDLPDGWEIEKVGMHDSGHVAVKVRV